MTSEAFTLPPTMSDSTNTIFVCALLILSCMASEHEYTVPAYRGPRIQLSSVRSSTTYRSGGKSSRQREAWVWPCDTRDAKTIIKQATRDARGLTLIIPAPTSPRPTFRSCPTHIH